MLELHERLIEKKKEELAYESAQNISTKNLSALEGERNSENQSNLIKITHIHTMRG